MTCYTCKEIIKPTEDSKTVMTACPDGPRENGMQCLVAHMGTVHVDCPNKPLSQIEKLEKRIKLLERMLYTRWCGITKLQPDAGDGAFEDFIKAYEHEAGMETMLEQEEGVN